MGSREVRFSFSSDAERSEWEAYAKGRGFTLSGLAKAALFAYRNRSPGGRHDKIRGGGVSKVALAVESPGAVCTEPSEGNSMDGQDPENA